MFIKIVVMRETDAHEKIYSSRDWLYFVKKKELLSQLILMGIVKLFPNKEYNEANIIW